MHHFVKETVIKATPERVFAFHELSDAFERLMPPLEKSRIIKAPENLLPGTKTIIETNVLGPIKQRWVALHTEYDPPRMFEDIQLSGPFKSWRHRHIVEAHPEGALLRDDIEYEMPFWPLSEIARPFVVVPRLRKLFEYRHAVTRRWCESEVN